MVMWWQLSRFLPLIPLKTVGKYMFLLLLLQKQSELLEQYYTSGKALNWQDFFRATCSESQAEMCFPQYKEMSFLYLVHILPATEKWKFSDIKYLILLIWFTCLNEHEIALS